MSDIFNTITNLDINFLEKFEKIASIILSVVSIFGIIIGVYMAHSYTSKIKEKKYDSLFGFCSRLSNYLRGFRYILDTIPEKSILLYCYNKESFKNNNNIFIPDIDEITSFTEQIKNFFDFIKNTDNQIPLSLEFDKAFKQLQVKFSFLSDLGKVAPYGNYDNESGRKRIQIERDEIIKLIVLLLDIIDEKQKDIIEKLEISTLF